MNILQIHNFYQRPGGEDISFQSETDLLSQAGHRVVTFTAHNAALSHMSRPRMAAKAIWNAEIGHEVFDICRNEKIDVAIFHNTFPLISPSAYRAVKASGGRVVQWLRNYRLVCPAATLFRDGVVCEDCIGQPFPFSAIVHRCYRRSLGATAATVGMLVYHRARRTWVKDVDRFVALTEFVRDKHVAGGLPADRISVIPNYLSNDPGEGSGAGGYALFVGRLSEEKGIRTLLRAWEILRKTIPLKIYGDGPLRQQVVEAAKEPGVEWHGQCRQDEVMSAMRGAMLLVFPSQWYEGLPRTIIEAFASGTPVIASNVGSLVELVEDNVTGRRFRPGDHIDLCQTIIAVLPKIAQMRGSARQTFQDCYSARSATESLTYLLEEVTHD